MFPIGVNFLYRIPKDFLRMVHLPRYYIVIMIKLSNAAFKWSTTPQLFPEKAIDGQDVYGRYWFGQASNASITIAHGIPNLTKKAVRIWGTVHHGSPGITDVRPLPYVEESGAGGNSIRVGTDDTNFVIYAANAGAYSTCRFTVYCLFTQNNLTLA